MATYSVVKGDSLSKIARDNGTTVEALMKANPDIKDANKISIGQSINITADSGGSAASSTSSAETATDEVGDGSDLLLPGGAMLWHNTDTDTYWVVYEVPGATGPDGKTSEPIYTGWSVDSDEDLEAVVGPDNKPIAAFSGGNDSFTSRGVVDLGGVDEIRDFDGIEGDPFDTWAEDLTKLAQVKPWLLEPDFVALAVEASMERANGQVTLEEIQTTNWWKNHNAQERSWMETANGDPATADMMIADNRQSLRKRLADAGVANATDDVINWMADRTTTGAWTTNYLESQINAVADPYSVDELDSELMEYMAGSEFTPDTTRKDEDTVRNNLQKWLGPVWGDWTDEEIAAKAGELRNNPDGTIEFIESLKDQRMAMYPNHADRNLSYEAIAQPWRSYTQSLWGAPVEDTDSVFQDVLSKNNPEEASKILRRAGLERGYERVTNDLVGGVESGSRTNVRGAV